MLYLVNQNLKDKYFLIKDINNNFFSSKLIINNLISIQRKNFSYIFFCIFHHF